MSNVHDYLARIDNRVRHFVDWIDRPEHVHQLAHDVATVTPALPLQDRLRLLVQSYARNRRPRLFATERDWQQAGIKVNKNASPLLIGGRTQYWRLGEGGPDEPTPVIRDHAELPVVVMFEVADTSAANDPRLQRREVGQPAASLVARPVLYQALDELSRDVLRSPAHPLLQLPDGSTVSHAAIREAALEVGVTMTRSEVWGLNPDLSGDESRSVWRSPANRAGAVTELVLARATAVTLPVVDAYRDLAGDGTLRPTRAAMLHDETSLQPTRDLYTQMNVFQSPDTTFDR